MSDNFVCGFSRKLLVSSRAAPTIYSICRTLSLFTVCADRAIRDAREQEVAQVLDVMQDTVIGLYARLWSIRDSFLTGKCADSEGDMATSSSSVAANMLDILHLTLSALAKLAAETLKDSDRKFNSLETRFPHIILLNWVYGVNPETRSRALVSLWIVEYVDDTECDPWMDFFTGALGGCLSNEHIANAIVRDLADEDTVDRELKNVLGFLSVRHDFTNNVEKNLPFNTLLAAYCLAAMRRQQCRGNRQELGLFLQSVAPWVFRNFYTGLEIRGRQCYAFFDSLCDWIMFSIEDNTTGLDANIMKITDWYLQHIANRAKDSRPKTVALRRASLTAWQAAADAMARHQLEKHPQWSGLVRLWSAIRTKMLPAPPAPVYAPFAPFERCAWRECLCSRHKPAHRMRMCKGCEQAFYCGTRCLERDWEDGGHRTRCLGRAA